MYTCKYENGECVCDNNNIFISDINKVGYFYGDYNLNEVEIRIIRDIEALLNDNM